MSSEASDHIENVKVEENDPVKEEDEQQNDIDSTNSKTDENNEANATNVGEQDNPQNETADLVQMPATDESLDVSTKSEGRKGLRRAKTKGELKKQLELKKEKLRNPLLEANDSDSIPSPHSVTEQKHLETSIVKVPKEVPETTVKWTEGDMFWARVTGHPWWPCMVFKDPIQTLFTRMMRANLRAYHFHFFGSSCERGWVVESSMMVFEGKEKFEEIRKEKMAQLGGLKARSKSEKTLRIALMSFDIKSNRMSTWNAAVEEAEKVVAMDHEGRMKYVGEILSSSKKKKAERRESAEGMKRKREDQGDEPSKKKPRKSEGALKSKANPEVEEDESKAEAADETMETNVDESILEGDQPTEDQTNDLGSTQTPSVTQGSKTANHIEATPERAVSTRYKLRAVRKLKKLTDDEEEEDGGDPKTNRKLSVASVVGEESDVSEDSQDVGCVATKPKGGEAVRTQEVFKLSHNNSNNYKKEEVCVRCESSHPGVIKCKGPCHAPLHPACVGVQLTRTGEGQESKDAEFICDECREGQHNCFICKKKDSTTVKCGVSTCCFYYHIDCIKKLKYVKFEKNQPICPMHVCISCAADSEKTHLSNRGRFFKCIRCPNSYHTGDFCLAGGSVVLSNTWIICGDHHVSESRRKHQDHLNAAFCFSCGQGGSLVCCESCPASYHTECCEEKPPAEGKWNCELCTDGKRPMYGEIVWCKAGIYRWWPGEVCHPRNIPTNIQNLPHGIGEFPVYFFGSNDYLWTHRGRVFSFQEGDKGTKQGHSRHLIGTFNKALEEADDAARVYYEERNKKEQKFLDKKPTPYRHVKSNVPIGNVEIYKVPLSEVPRCQCTATMDNPCGPESDCINRLMMYECDVTVCSGGDRCTNRNIQMKNDADTEVFRTTDNRGWGLRAKTNILKGRLVHEYVGDLVDEEECRARLKKARDQNITNFYMLTLDKNRIIDAGPKGNNSRFMNHSCQPNCETQKWYVNGDVRVALFALREIKAGEELTFNYNLECLGDKKTVCNCGTPVCSGFLGERPKSSPTDNSRPPKKQRKKQKNLSKLAPLHEDICYRCGNPGELVLCDKVNCTKSYHLQCLKLNQLPKGKWICPWHLCDEENCGKWAIKLCTMCPNSYCSKHSEGNISTLTTGRMVCDEHPPTCPQLQYLLAQDEAELERKKEAEEEKKVNGDVQANDVSMESPFPLVSTPFPKKGRGRPPKHPKLGESPIVGSAAKAKSLKVARRNHKLSASNLISAKDEESPGHNHVSTLDASLSVDQSNYESDMKVVNGQNEESTDAVVKDKSEEQSHDEQEASMETQNNPRSADVLAEMSTEVKSDSSEEGQTSGESRSPRKSNDEECSSPPKKRRRTSEEPSETNISEKLSNGFPDVSQGPSPRPSIHQAREESGGD